MSDRTGSSPAIRTRNPECESIQDFCFLLLHFSLTAVYLGGLMFFLVLLKRAMKRNIRYFSKNSSQSVALRNSNLINKKIKEILCVLGIWGALVKLDNKLAFTNRI